MARIFFTADTHFNHRNIVKYCEHRPYPGADASKDHDEWLTEMWNATVGKKDTVYIVGDLAFGSQEATKKLLERLHGHKHLVVGNHDASGRKLPNYFESVSEIKDLTFKAALYPFLQRDFSLALCHYPMVSWSRKSYGACMVHGHCHGNIDDYNLHSGELRVDVGIDGRLARECGGLIPLERLYEHFLGVAGTDDFAQYVHDNYERNPI